MSIKNITIIRDIFGEEHVYDEKKPHPDLWEVGITLNHVNNSGSVSPRYQTDPNHTIFVKRELLENHGLLPKSYATKKEIKQTETIENLLLKILDHLGVQPSEV